MTRPSEIPPGGRALRGEEYAEAVESMAKMVQTSHLFKSLDDAGREEVLESGYVTTFDEGEEIIRQGDEGAATMYLILRGRVSVKTTEPSGEVHLAELGKGACIGEVAVLTGAKRTATVTAIEPVDAVAFEKHRIERVLDHYPKVRELLETLVERRAQDTVEKILR